MLGSASWGAAGVSWLPAPKEVEACAPNPPGDGATKGEAAIPSPEAFEAIDDAAATGVV